MCDRDLRAQTSIVVGTDDGGVRHCSGPCCFMCSFLTERFFVPLLSKDSFGTAGDLKKCLVEIAGFCSVCRSQAEALA